MDAEQKQAQAEHRARKDALQRRIDKASRYERLSQGFDFQMFMDDIRKNRDVYDEQLKDPEVYKLGIKMGMEKNYIRYIESNIAYNNFNYVLDKVNIEILAGKRAQKQLDQLLDIEKESL